MKKRCPLCHAVRESEFCPYDGTKMGLISPACPKCGYPVMGVMCPKCGFRRVRL